MLVLTPLRFCWWRETYRRGRMMSHDEVSLLFCGYGFQCYWFLLIAAVLSRPWLVLLLPTAPTGGYCDEHKNSNGALWNVMTNKITQYPCQRGHWKRSEGYVLCVQTHVHRLHFHIKSNMTQTSNETQLIPAKREPQPKQQQADRNKLHPDPLSSCYIKIHYS